MANAWHCERLAAVAAVPRWMHLRVSRIPQIPIPRLRRTLDRRCRAGELVLRMAEVQEVQEVPQVQGLDALVVHAAVAGVPAGEAVELPRVRSSSRSR